MKNFNFFKSKKQKSDSKQISSSMIEWPDHVVILDDNNFENFIRKYPLSVIDFWAPWCAPCKAMAPRLRRLSNIYRGKVAFGKINIQNYKDISKKYKIMGIPNLIFFRFGKKVASITGIKSVGNIKDVIEDILKKGD